MRKLLQFLLVGLFSFSLIACGDKSGDDGKDGGSANDNSETIKIGHFGSLTGNTATFGQETQRGLELAVEELNANGGLLGKKVELITEDTRSQTQDAGLAAEKLIGQDKVAVLIGEVASSLSLVAAPIAEREKVPMITPASTNPKVTVADGKVRDYVFRICFIDPFQGKVMAKFAKENLNAQRVAILTDNANDYSVGLAQNFKETFLAMGGEIVEQQAYEAGQVDFKSQLTAIRAKNPDAIYVPGYYTEVSLIAIQARELGITVPLMGGDGWDSPELTKGAAKQALEGTFFSNHYSVEDTTARVREFADKFQKKFGQAPGAMSALGYDAMMIAAHVIEQAKTTDPAALVKGLAGLKDFPAVTGNITIDAEHNAEKSAVILQIKDGKFAYYATVKP